MRRLLRHCSSHVLTQACDPSLQPQKAISGLFLQQKASTFGLDATPTSFVPAHAPTTALQDILEGECDRVFTELGTGANETHYQNCLAYFLQQRGHAVVTEMVLPVVTRAGFNVGFCRLDLMIDHEFVLEVKAVRSAGERMHQLHLEQCQFYMRQLERNGRPVSGGAVINFGREGPNVSYVMDCT